MAEKYDQCILGSGFASSLLAIVLAKQGQRVCMIDRSGHPRFAIGESSTPIADYLMGQIADRYELDWLRPFCRFGTWRSSYPEIDVGCKRGFSYLWHGLGDQYRATFNHACEMLVAASPSRQASDTQWLRSDFDHFLCVKAAELGVRVLSDCEIVGFDQDRQAGRWTVQVRDKSGAFAVAADFLVDGSGPASPLMNHLQVPNIVDQLRTSTVANFSHFDDWPLSEQWLRSRGASVDDFPFPVDQAAVHHLFCRGWLWNIRFESGRTSVGWVRCQQAPFQPPTTVDRDQISQQNLASQLAPDLADNPLSRVTLDALLAGARLAVFPGVLYRSGRLQHLRDRASGDGWAALPFTAGFIDPLHSTGIAHSLSGVARLAQALCQSSWQQRHGELAEYGRRLPWEIKHLDNLISLCYESLEDFELFCSSSMLYFAAATKYERLHSQGLQPSFLLADDECFNQVVAQAQALMEVRKQVRDEKQLLAANQNYTLQIQQLVEPFNHVGLFDPAAHNMYRHTVAP